MCGQDKIILVSPCKWWCGRVEKKKEGGPQAKNWAVQNR